MHSDVRSAGVHTMEDSSMGAKDGNAAFQSMMEDLLQPLQDCAYPFINKIIIGSGTEDMTDD